MTPSLSVRSDGLVCFDELVQKKTAMSFHFLVFILLSQCFFPDTLFPAMKTFLMQSLTLLCFTAIVGCVVTANADPIQVNKAEELIRLFNSVTGSTLQIDIDMTADLDFSDSTLTLPLGAFSNGTCVAYSGVFRGNGHSIKGLKINNRKYAGYNNSGLFCSLKDATVENLVIDSSCSFTGYYGVGVLSVSVCGSLTVTNTTNKAAVGGSFRVGGFIGLVEDLEQSAVLSFEDCVNDGV